MAQQEILDLIKQSIATWNTWRRQHSEIQLDLSKADLKGVYPPLPFKQSEQLQQMLHAFHTIEARQFYPHVRHS